MRVVGIDLSLTATGVCTEDGGYLVKPPDTVKGMLRLQWVWDRIRPQIGLHALRSEPVTVFIEGYSMGTARQTSHAHGLGELGGHVRYQLWDRHVPVVEVPPASLKKFATGKGNCGKDAMIATAARVGCPHNDNNVVDAWWLWQLGLYSHGTGTLTKTGYRYDVVANLGCPNVSFTGRPPLRPGADLMRVDL